MGRKGSTKGKKQALTEEEEDAMLAEFQREQERLDLPATEEPQEPAPQPPVDPKAAEQVDPMLKYTGRTQVLSFLIPIFAAFCIRLLLSSFQEAPATSMQEKDDTVKTNPNLPEDMGRLTETGFDTCHESQPLYTLEPSVFTDDELAQLKSNILNMSLVEESVTTTLNPTQFTYSRGFMLRFNLEGIPQLQDDERYQPLLPIFNKLRRDDTNAFVFNVLTAKSKTFQKAVVGWHVDDTVGIDEDLDVSFVAHEVSVFYLQVPQDMEGGGLKLIDLRGDISQVNLDSDVNSQEVREEVQPQENSIVRFRGDACHQVMGYKTETPLERVSVVLEQYKIPPYYYKDTYRFEETVGNMETYWKNIRYILYEVWMTDLIVNYSTVIRIILFSYIMWQAFGHLLVDKRPSAAQ